MARTVVTEKQWLLEGVRRFGGKGLDGLNVEEMAKSLGCAKSGFYWYFRSRQEFLSRLIGHWISLETEAYIVRAELEPEPAARILSLFGQVARGRDSGDFLFHLRSLAGREVEMRKTL